MYSAKTLSLTTLRQTRVRRLSQRLCALFFFLLLNLPLAAQWEGLASSEVTTYRFPKREARAVWVTTLGGLDWPRVKAGTPESMRRQQAEWCELLDRLKAIQVNTILLQTRVRGSVIYPSAIEPWDVALTGHYGRSPGYDPLRFAIDEAHKRGMELHAWVVTIPAYKVAQAKQMGRQGLHVKQAALIKRHEEQYYLDPGQPATATYLTRICEEIVRNYDVDGIHFDYIRYPENAARFPDADTYRKYGKGQSKAQWRRDNVTRIVRSIYEHVKALKPWVRVSSSPVGKYRDLSRYSSRGWNCYDAVHQDAQGWLQEGIQDALYPMMYFKDDHFFPFAADWKEQARGRLVAPGLGIYFLSPSEKNWPLSDITQQLWFTRAQGLGGQCYFRSRFLTDNVKGLYDYLQHTFYPYPALTPAATWLDSVPPSAPTGLRTDTLQGDWVRLSWDVSTDNVPEGGVRYNVYASCSVPVDTRRAENLVATALPTPYYTYNALVLKQRGLHLQVTAMDRFGNESRVELPEEAEGAEGLPWVNFYDRVAVRHEAVAVPTHGRMAHRIALPSQEGVKFYAITNLQGHIVQTGAYAPTVDVRRLPAGWYQLRTLYKKGSRRVMEFWKKP